MKRIHESPVPMSTVQNVNTMNSFASSSNNVKKAIVDNNAVEESNTASQVNPTVYRIKTMPFFTHPNSAFRPVVPKGDGQEECVHKSSTSDQQRVKPSADNGNTCFFVSISRK